MREVNIKLTDDTAKVPTYATDGSGAFDLYACESATIFTRMSLAIRTGVSMEIPEGHVMLLFSRSGQGFAHNVRLANCVGVIDSDYRGEIKVKLTNDSNMDYFTVNRGDRIAQGMIIPVERVVFNIVKELSSTVRGEGGFGSTGK